MALMDFIKKQFVDVIHWTEDSNGVLAMRYPMQDFEIQYGAQLTVRESQLALFVNEGQIADVFTPGLYKLTTRTLPLLTNLKNWDKLFESPFKSDVYFFSTRLQLDCKWGTPNPISIRDKEFGMVRLRVHRVRAQVRERVACAVRGDLAGHRVQRGGVPEQLQESRGARLAHVKRQPFDGDDRPRRDGHRDQHQQQRLAHGVAVGDEVAEAQGAGVDVHVISPVRSGSGSAPSPAPAGRLRHRA